MSRPRGYGLLELLISALLVTILLGGLYTVFFQGQATFEAQQDSMGLRQQSRVVTTLLEPELRMAGYDLGTVPNALITAKANSFAFAADIDDGAAAAPCGAAIEAAAGGGAERLTYTLDTSGSPTLLRSVDCWNGVAWTADIANQVVATELLAATSLFRYFDIAGAELMPTGGVGADELTAAQLAAVRTVIVTLSFQGTDQQVFGETYSTFQTTTRIKLRNLGS